MLYLNGISLQDLYSVMIRGPEKTPYEDGLFVFDFQLSPNYPNEPPLCHYISYCSDRLNPNLYEDGKVCVSLLGTWSGKGTELWSSSSNLLQVIISIQGKFYQLLQTSCLHLLASTTLYIKNLYMLFF